MKYVLPYYTPNFIQQTIKVQTLHHLQNIGFIQQLHWQSFYVLQIDETFYQGLKDLLLIQIDVFESLRHGHNQIPQQLFFGFTPLSNVSKTECHSP